MKTDKLKETLKSNVYSTVQQKTQQTADFWKSNFSKEAINKTIEAAKNSVVITKAKNVHDPANIKAAAAKTYEDVVKTPIAKTQAALKEMGEQTARLLGGNNDLALEGASGHSGWRIEVENVDGNPTFQQIVGNRDGGGEGTININPSELEDKKNNDFPTAFKQEEFASAYESRIKQTPAELNLKVSFEGARGESLCVLKPPPDPTLQKILNEAGVNGIEYKNGVPNFSPVAKAQIEIDYMLGGKGSKGKAARDYNFDQANEKLASQLNNSSELARQFGMESGGITAKDIEKYRVVNKLTWHELNDGVTMQLVPTEINAKFGHLGGVGEINAGAYEPGGFANK